MKIKFGFLLVFVALLAGCSKSTKTEISNTEDFSLDKYTLKIDSAKVEDDTLKLIVDWKFGFNEDSMEQEKFAASGVIISATQNGDQLEENIDDANYYEDVYEGNDGAIYPEFKLKNTTDQVTIVFNRELSNENNKIKVSFK